MRSEAAAVQPLLCRWGDQVFLRQRECGLLLRLFLCCGLSSAAHPEKPAQIHASRRYRLRIECVGYIDPGADLRCLRHAGKKGKSQGDAPGAFRTNNFGDGTERQATFEQVIDCLNPGSRKRANSPWRRSKRRGDPVSESCFDLQAKCCGGRHGVLSPYVRRSVVTCQPILCCKSCAIVVIVIKIRGLFLDDSARAALGLRVPRFRVAHFGRLNMAWRRPGIVRVLHLRSLCLRRLEPEPMVGYRGRSHDRRHYRYQLARPGANSHGLTPHDVHRWLALATRYN